MSNENRLEAQTSSLGIYDTAKKIPRQGGKIQRLVLTGPDVSLPHQSAYPPVRLERQTALQENPLDRILDKITARFRLGLTATFGLGAAVLPQASTFAQVEQQQDNNQDGTAEVAGVQIENPIISPALDGDAREIVDVPQEEDTSSQIETNPDELSVLSQTFPQESSQELTPHQRVVKNLKELFAAKDMNRGSATGHNPLGLDLLEIEEYANNPKKTQYRTFIIWSKPGDTPSIIIATGSRPEGTAQGLTYPQHIKAVMAGLDLVNKLNSQIIDDHKLKAVAGNILLFKINGAAGGFDTNLGIIFLSEIGSEIGDGSWDTLARAYILVVEMRHIRTISNPDFPGRLHPNSGIEKALYANKLIDQNPNILTDGEKRAWRDLSEQVISFYKRNPGLGG